MFASGLRPWFAPWLDVRSVSLSGTPSTTNSGLDPDDTEATPLILIVGAAPSTPEDCTTCTPAA